MSKNNKRKGGNFNVLSNFSPNDLVNLYTQSVIRNPNIHLRTSDIVARDFLCWCGGFNIGYQQGYQQGHQQVSGSWTDSGSGSGTGRQTGRQTGSGQGASMVPFPSGRQISGGSVNLSNLTPNLPDNIRAALNTVVNKFGTGQAMAKTG